MFVSMRHIHGPSACAKEMSATGKLEGLHKSALFNMSGKVNDQSAYCAIENRVLTARSGLSGNRRLTWHRTDDCTGIVQS